MRAEKVKTILIPNGKDSISTIHNTDTYMVIIYVENKNGDTLNHISIRPNTLVKNVSLSAEAYQLFVTATNKLPIIEFGP